MSPPSPPPSQPPSRPSSRPPAPPTPSDLLPGALLLVSGLLVGVAAVVGVAVAADGGPRGGVPVAAFAAVLPGLAAVALGLVRPTAALVVTAAAGWWGIARLLVDLSLLDDPGAVVRPELFAETSARSQPFGSASGVWLLLLADGLWIAAGVLATRAVAPRLLPDRPAAAPLFGEVAAVSDPSRSDLPLPTTDGRDERTRWSLPVVLVGLLGVVLVAVGGLDPGYSGGFLDLRALPPGTGVLGVLGTGLAVLVAGALVLVAAAASRPIAVPLLVGSALAAAVPFLTALLVVTAWGGALAPALSGSVWWGLAGAALLAVAGWLAPSGATSPDDPDPEATGADGVPAPAAAGTAPAADGARVSLIAAGLALLAGAAGVGAAVTPFLLVGGQPPAGAAAEVTAPIGSPFAVAAVPLLIAGVLIVLPPTRRAGLIAAGVLAAGPVLALTQALVVRGTVLASVSNPLNATLDTTLRPTWGDGPGYWLAWLAVAAALVAAGLAGTAARRLSDAATVVADDASVAASRPVRTGLAAGLTVLTLVAFAVPIWSTLGRGAASTLLFGYDVDTWGLWAIAVAIIAAVVVAARTERTDVAVAAPLAAAVAAVQPLLVPAAIRAQVGFSWGAGSWLVGALVVLLVAAAPVFGAQARRIRPRSDAHGG